MFSKLRVLFAVLCAVCILSFVSLQSFEEKSAFAKFDDYCFFGTEHSSPKNYSEDAIKRDILSKLPRNLRAEVSKNLRKTEIIYRNDLGRAMGETACPYQVLLVHRLDFK